MIALCTGTPAFAVEGDQIVVSFPSGRGEAVRVALTRNQLCHLLQRSQNAKMKAFAEPQADLTEPILFHTGGSA